MTHPQIAGLSWVTPLGTDLKEVFDQLRAGVQPDRGTLTHPQTKRTYPFLFTPPSAIAHLSRHPRLRRASIISQIAVAAGLAAIADAGLDLTPQTSSRTALVCAVCNGGVNYTRRFYEQIVTQGASSASPLLFPETVYNAPTSHLASLLGIDGASYTLVGDGVVGLAALDFARDLLATGDADQVLVVAAEEGDWILCQAYAPWGLARLPLAEGAGAVLLSNVGRWNLQTHPGARFSQRRQASKALAEVLKTFGPVEEIFTSANGSFIDQSETAALSQCYSTVPTFSIKASLGEAFGASALMQIVAAAVSGRPSLVTAVGGNDQVGAARVTPVGR